MLTRLFYHFIRFGEGKIRYKSHVFTVEIADSFSKQALGLMYRKSMKKDHGMLLAFNKEGRYDIWMMNMRFPIDILWLSASGKILKIAEKAVPCKSLFSCPPYKSPENAKYVLELNAGTVHKVKMRIGDRISLKHSLIEKMFGATKGLGPFVRDETDRF